MSRNLIRFLSAATPDPVSDAELLRRYAAGRDEAAFELLVRRHADAVWRTCRHIARSGPDAEDAFQATFLALARKAGSVRGPAGGWLYRVAVNAALKARARSARADAPVDPTALREVPARSDAAADPELAGAVHEEVARLAEEYRLPVLLCELEGHTHADAARRLGWPVGTVAGRLSRARALLRRRLERRGLALPAAGVFLTGAGGQSAGPELVRAAVAIGAGGASPPAVVLLTEGVLSAMRATKLTLAAAFAVVAVGTAGTGTAWVLAQDFKPKVVESGTSGPDRDRAMALVEREVLLRKIGHLLNGSPTPFPEIPRLKEPDWNIKDRIPKLEANDDLRTNLLKRKLLAAYTEMICTRQILVTGTVAQGEFEGFLSNYRAVSKDLAAAAIELWSNPDDLRPWLEWCVAVAKDVERVIIERAPHGELMRPQNRFVVQHVRLDAELALLTLLEKPRKK